MSKLFLVCCWVLPILCNAHQKLNTDTSALITPHEACVGREYTVGSGLNHKLKMWVSDRLQRVSFVYIISWFPYISPSTQMYTLHSWRTFITTLGGAILVQENVPSNEDKIPGRRYGFRADFRKEGGKLAHWLMKAVAELGFKSNHPELQYAPVVLWGFSREGMHPPSFGEVYHHRLLGGIRYTSHLRDDVFDYAGKLSRIPFFTTIGEKDNVAKFNNIDFLRLGRKYNTPWSCTMVHDAKHGDGYFDERTTIFQFPWMVDLLSQVPGPSLQSAYSHPVPLSRPVTVNNGWLGNMERIIERCCAFRGEPDTHKGSLDGNSFAIAPFNEFHHNVSSATWLSCETMARVWKEVNEHSPTTQIGAQHTHPVALLMDHTEPDCSAVFLLVRTRADLTQHIQLQINGTATAGVDFIPLPREVVMPPGVFGAKLYLRRTSSGSPTATTLSVGIVPSNNVHPLATHTVSVSLPPGRPQAMQATGGPPLQPPHEEEGRGSGPGGRGAACAAARPAAPARQPLRRAGQRGTAGSGAGAWPGANRPGAAGSIHCIRLEHPPGRERGLRG